MPGITIVSAGGNTDVTIDELGFNVITAEDLKLDITFSESDPLRNLSGLELSNGLVQRVEKESKKQKFAQ